VCSAVPAQLCPAKPCIVDFCLAIELTYMYSLAIELTCSLVIELTA
jgi:hypothetical protein